VKLTGKGQLELHKTVKNIKCFFLLVLVLVGVADSDAESGYDYFEKLGVNILLAKTTGGFLEYEFFPDGKLVSYEYIRDGTDSGPHVVDSSFLPKFRIEFLQWHIERNSIVIYHGNRRSKSEIRSDEKHVYFSDLVWLKEKRLEFFDEVSKHTGTKISLECLEKQK
jgi:hypothetical protein